MAADGPATQSGLCAPQETVYFFCSAGKGRSIALCGAAERTLQYRFGRQHAIELAYPRDAKEGAKALRYSHYFRARTDRFEIRFENEGVEYVLFDYQEDARRQAGVQVTTTDGKERETLCTAPPQSRLGRLQGVLPCDADSALNGGRCP
ncbi:MAG: hypothetical protein M3Z15_14165 [Pseudomonadota bacterium]|nr:hypothetical protein [Pseudomonadota bacterium]